MVDMDSSQPREAIGRHADRSDDPRAGDRSTPFRKLDPRMMVQEPGDVRGRGRRGADHDPVHPRPGDRRRRAAASSFQINLWLWFTVLFANFAEAMAEGRGKAQAATLRKTKTETMAKRLRRRGVDDVRVVPATGLQAGRRRAGRGRRHHPVRRRGDRGRRLGRRGGDHRRIRAGDPRERRRPLGRHRRHAGALRLDQGADHRRSPARPSSTA